MKKRLFQLITYFALISTCAAETGTQTNIEHDATPDAPRQSQTMVLNIQGEISRNLLKNIKEITATHSPTGFQFPANLVVLLDSTGGDGMAAIEIGRLLRQLNAHIFVTNRCASACVFVLVGGVYKSSIPYSIGLHQPRLTISDKNAKVIKELKSDAKNQELMDGFDQQAQLYLKEMKVPDEFFGFMKNIPSKEMHWLTPEEVARFKLEGYEAEYLKTYIEGMKTKVSIFSNREEIISKSDRVLKICTYYKNDPHYFVRCYSEVLDASNF